VLLTELGGGGTRERARRMTRGGDSVLFSVADGMPRGIR